MTVPQMIEALECYDVSAERKSIYDDLEALRLFGLDIETVKTRTTGYFVGNRMFQLPELKLLVDSVQASKFITHKKSMELIKKIESFSSVYEAQLLQRQVYVANRIKTMNESIYYNIDEIHSAIGKNKKIKFRYFEYTITKERKFRKNGESYHISPYALTWDDENYYMLGYDSDAKIMKHYRVDKMMNIDMMEEKRDGQQEFEKFDMAVYSKKLFSMFGGEEETVKLKFANHLIGVVLDRFGKEISVVPWDEENFTVHVIVRISPQFFAWLFGFGKEAEILYPPHIAEQMKVQIKDVEEVYR